MPGTRADGWLPKVALLGDHEAISRLSLHGLIEGWGHDVSVNLRTVEGWCSHTVLCVQMGHEASPHTMVALTELREIAAHQRRLGMWPHRIVVVRLVPKEWRFRAVFGQRNAGPRVVEMDPRHLMARGWATLLAESDGDEWLATQQLDLLVRAAMRADAESAESILPTVWGADRGGARFAQLSESLDGTSWHGLEGLEATLARYFSQDHG